MKEEDMKKLILLIGTLFIVNNVSALELVCRGAKNKSQNQRIHWVDCMNRQEVIDTLGASWMLIKDARLGEYNEGYCLTQFQIAKKIHPNLTMSDVNNAFYMCNIGLEKVK